MLQCTNARATLMYQPFQKVAPAEASDPLAFSDHYAEYMESPLAVAIALGHRNLGAHTSKFVQGARQFAARHNGRFDWSSQCTGTDVFGKAAAEIAKHWWYAYGVKVELPVVSQTEIADAPAAWLTHQFPDVRYRFRKTGDLQQDRVMNEAVGQHTHVPHTKTYTHTHRHIYIYIYSMPNDRMPYIYHIYTPLGSQGS